MSPDTIVRFEELEDKIDATASKVDGLSDKMDTNTEITMKLQENTLPLVEIIESLRPAVKVGQQVAFGIGWILDKVKRFGLTVAGVAAFIYAIFHGDGLTAAVTAFFKAIAGPK